MIFFVCQKLTQMTTRTQIYPYKLNSTKRLTHFSNVCRVRKILTTMREPEDKKSTQILIKKEKLAIKKIEHDPSLDLEAVPLYIHQSAVVAIPGSFLEEHFSKTRLAFKFNVVNKGGEDPERHLEWNIFNHIMSLMLFDSNCFLLSQFDQVSQYFQL